MNYFSISGEQLPASFAVTIADSIVVKNVSRRSFLKGLGFASSAFVLAAGWSSSTHASIKWNDKENHPADFEPNVYVRITTSNDVIVTCHRSEMGQGIRTSMPMLIADELGAAWSSIKVEQALANSKYGSQNTDGSTSIRKFYELIRLSAATARTMLITAAANQWQVEPSECEAIDSKVIHSVSNRSILFGDLVAEVQKLEEPAYESVRLKSSKQFRWINQSKKVPLVDGFDIATGNTTFGIDVYLPNMKVAVIARPPVLASKVKSFDSAAALEISGVVDIVQLDDLVEPALYKPMGGIAVIANNTWAAEQGRKALKIEWEWSEHRTHNSQEQRKQMSESLDHADTILRDKGDVEKTQSGAKNLITSEYYVPRLVHAPMEPPMAVADYKDGNFNIWASTQAPQAAQDTVAQLTGVKKKNINLYVTLLGGGFGRKSKADHVAEAAILSKRLGYPIKVTWLREEDIQQSYYHAESLQRLSSTIDVNNQVESWLHRVAEPPIGATFQKGADLIGGESNLGLIDVPFNIPHLRCVAGRVKAHHRIGWLRSVTNINHAFAVSSFADELAAHVKKDPKDFLLELIGPDRKIDLSKEKAEYSNYGEDINQHPIDTGRLKQVIKRVAQNSGWDKRAKQNRFLGIAAHRSFVSYVAAVAEVEKLASGKLKLKKIWIACDCGTVVNLDRVHSQMEGAAIFGSSIALYSEINSTQGVINQSNFHDYRLTRMNEAPEVDVDVIISEHPPGGVGEPGVPPIAPAIANAVFAATGKRYRDLPLTQHNIFD